MVRVLTQLPGQFSSAEQMDVDMLHDLPSVRAAVDGYPVTLMCQSLFCRKKDGDMKQVAHQSQVPAVQFRQVCVVFFGGYEDMGWGLRVYVPESEDALVLEYFRTGDYSSGYFAENAIFHVRLTSCGIWLFVPRTDRYRGCHSPLLPENLQLPNA
jgi:hypothetical protein